MKNLKIINHPLVEHYLSIMRDKSTGQVEFKNSLDKISYLLAAEAYSTSGLENKAVNTPFKKINGKKVKDKIIILPILRAGLGLTKGFIDLYPEAVTSHIGIYRDEESLKPVKYYFRFPKFKDKSDLNVIILDPMIATGGSVIFTIEYLLNMGIRKIRVASLLCAPEGINAINNRFNKSEKRFIEIITCALDERLNEKGYIVPGLGDAGDRMFGT
ncbi:MAG: uracil phosphoribosyltransferase [Ignavibacteria bacterium]|nr:uracil phosphoribosyltransferase [Ignavibacteria bacterium]MBK6771516.1 uracil phosphoribosyltransferase [Ignavibacteria bacterium]MBK7254282.1 uracil phosphoribosyltransferase [Ignavibacteria bacterium]MBK9405072.1 uracil phosphoribosyltransferase [Ignavibacteria bacterium]